MAFLDRDHAWKLFGVALVLRLAVFVFILFQFGDAGFILPPFSDGHGYVTIAENLISGNGFSLSETSPYVPDTKRVPLYPIFLAATFFITSGAFWLASLLQVCMGAGIAYLVYRATELLAGRRAAFFAGAAAAIFPFAVFLSTQLLAETLFTFLLFLGFVFLIRYFNAPTYAPAVVSGVLLGLATLTKPAGQYIPFLVVSLLALRSNGWRRLVPPAVFIMCFAVIITPWIARNHSVSGVATLSYEANILFDLHVAGYTALKETGAAGNADKYRMTTSSESLLVTSRSEYLKRIADIVRTDPIGFSKYLALSTVPFIFGDGFVTMVSALSAHNSLPAWNFSASGSAFGRTLGFGVLPPGLVFLSIAVKAFWGLVLLSALIGCISLLRSGFSRALLALAFVISISFFMVAGGPVQSARYRAPVEPLIYLLAGIGLARALQALEIHKKKHAPLPKNAN